SLIFGLLQIKYGLLIDDSPDSAVYSSRVNLKTRTREMKTALITGCSSGYGLEIARHFHAQGWNVVATMRTPRGGLLPGTERMRLLSLDVTRADSIAAAIDAAGPLDALVNNAGIGLDGAFEAMSM